MKPARFALCCSWRRSRAQKVHRSPSHHILPMDESTGHERIVSAYVLSFELSGILVGERSESCASHCCTGPEVHNKRLAYGIRSLPAATGAAANPDSQDARRGGQGNPPPAARRASALVLTGRAGPAARAHHPRPEGTPVHITPVSCGRSRGPRRGRRWSPWRSMHTARVRAKARASPRRICGAPEALSSSGECIELARATGFRDL